MAESPVQSPAGPLAAARAAYMGALDELDRDTAVTHVRTLTTEGHPVIDVVRDVLVPAQTEVGLQWEQGRRSVAWEHAATSISECALLSMPVPFPEEPRGRIVVTCAEGEGHTLPARMQAQLLSSLGWDAILLLPALEAPFLAEFLERRSVAAVAISCTLPRHLHGCLPLVEAAHRAGLPVMAGGAAFGADQSRAGRLGVDHHTDDAADAADHLGLWREQPPIRLAKPAPVDPEHDRLMASAGELLEEAMVVLAQEYPGWPADWSETDAAREDFSHALALVAAALLVEDERIVADGLAWRRRYWAARHEPMEAVEKRLAALVEVIPESLPRSAAMLQAATRR